MFSLDEEDDTGDATAFVHNLFISKAPSWHSLTGWLRGISCSVDFFGQQFNDDDKCQR